MNIYISTCSIWSHLYLHFWQVRNHPWKKFAAIRRKYFNFCFFSILTHPVRGGVSEQNQADKHIHTYIHTYQQLNSPKLRVLVFVFFTVGGNWSIWRGNPRNLCVTNIQHLNWQCKGQISSAQSIETWRLHQEALHWIYDSPIAGCQRLNK